MSLNPTLQTLGLLTLSNVFMTFAWYAHLKELRDKPWIIAAFVSWGIALTLNATDSVWFVLNDQYWDDHYARLNTHDAERLVDFTYIGDYVAAEARL